MRRMRIIGHLEMDIASRSKDLRSSALEDSLLSSTGKLEFSRPLSRIHISMPIL